MLAHLEHFPEFEFKVQHPWAYMRVSWFVFWPLASGLIHSEHREKP